MEPPRPKEDEPKLPGRGLTGIQVLVAQPHLLTSGCHFSKVAGLELVTMKSKIKPHIVIQFFSKSTLKEKASLSVCASGQ